MVKSRPSRKAFGWHRRALEALGPPPEVLVSEHAVPDPEIYGVARTRDAFDAIRKAAFGAGLVLGLPTRPSRKEAPSFVWGDEAERAVDAALRRELSEPPPYQDGAWPTGLVVWSDPPRSTFLAVIADPDCNNAEDIIAWGRDSERCLAAVEEALDDDALWD